jgi:hypothetical protein
MDSRDSTKASSYTEQHTGNVGSDAMGKTMMHKEIDTLVSEINKPQASPAETIPSE